MVKVLVQAHVLRFYIRVGQRVALVLFVVFGHMSKPIGNLSFQTLGMREQALTYQYTGEQRNKEEKRKRERGVITSLTYGSGPIPSHTKIKTIPRPTLSTQS